MTNLDNNLLLRDVLSATPLGRKGREALDRLKENMTLEVFLENLYVPPIKYIENNKLPKLDYPNSQDDFDDYETNMDYNEFITYMYDYNNSIKLLHDKGEYETKFKELNKSMYLIKGNAGCGKTTYFYNLKKEIEIEDQNCFFLICDLEFTLPYFDFLGKSKSFKKQNNIWTFVGFILNQTINTLFFPNIDNEINYNCDEIKNVFNMYNKEINIKYISPDDPTQQEVFEKLNEYANNIESFSDYYIGYLEDKFSNENNTKLIIEHVIGFIIRLFFCFSKLRNKKYILAIDSVEHYIFNYGPKRLQNSEIATIVNGIKGATDSMQTHIDRIKQRQSCPYIPFYAIVIIMRDTSEPFIFQSNHTTEHGYADILSIDISTWFDAKSITSKRERYFASKLKNMDTEKTFFDNVMSDTSIYRWGMHGMITRMYGYNHRGISDCLSSAISHQKTEDLEWFNKIWAIVNEKTILDKTEEDDLRILKYMCRQYVFRLLLDYVEETNYFDRILTPIENFNDDIKQYELNPYARKVVTLLHNKKIEDNTHPYVSFPDIIESVLVKHKNTQPTETEIKKLGEILFEMNETDTDKTNWNALIEINFNPNEDYTLEKLKQALIKAWKERSEPNDTSQYGVRIKTSGAFFADILSEFEYFACKRIKNGSVQKKYYSPLFEKNNFNIQDGKPFFIDSISNVKNQSIKIINAIINNEKHMSDNQIKKFFYKRNTNSKTLSYLQRIFYVHKGFLNNYFKFVNFILEKNLLKTFFSDEDKKNILNKLKEEIDDYETKLDEIKQKNLRYF